MIAIEELKIDTEKNEITTMNDENIEMMKKSHLNQSFSIGLVLQWKQE